MEDSHLVKPWDHRGLIEDVLARGMDDWLHLAEFVSIAKRTRVNGPEALRALALGLIAEVVCEGLMVPGDADEAGFHPWTLTPGDAIQRIVQGWSEDNLYPTPGSVAWFKLTPDGEKVGQGVLARESS
jgi:hypothetical protein